jgi:hypothetical protein
LGTGRCLKTAHKLEGDMKKLFAAVVAGLFAMTAVSGVIAADKKDDKKVEKKKEEKK